MKSKLHGSIILTYRCNARCNMCEVWQHPSNAQEEIGLDVIEKLPEMFFVNITGGEPFVRQDLPEIVEVLRTKAKRIVISTNGYFTDRIVDLCKRYPDIGIRISIEGLARANDEIRGIPNGFDRGLRTLLKLRSMGIKDIGFGMTVQDRNACDLVPLYQLACGLGYEFATATLHNSHYFHKWDNQIEDKEKVCAEFERLIKLLLGSKRPKDWFRAYFNYGLINYIKGNKRFLPCEMGQNGFFVDPWGDVLACNGMDKKMAMGNLKEQSWDEIWQSKRAQEIREAVKNCPKNCWMIGSAAPAIWQHPLKPLMWVMRNKLRGFRNSGLKIVVLGTRGFPNVQGGVEKHCEQLYPQLVKKGCKVVVLARKSYVGKDSIDYKGVKIVPLACPRNKFLEAFLHTLSGVFVAKRMGCDVLHIHAVGPSLFVPLARLLGMKVVMTHHGPDYARKKWNKLAKMILRVGEYLGSKWANGLICISDSIADNVRKKYRRKIDVIPNGVVLPELEKNRDSPQKAGTVPIFQKFGLKKSRYVLSVGRFVPEKGFDYLVDAFTRIYTDKDTRIGTDRKWKLVIAGDADHSDGYSLALKEKARKNGDVVLTGFLKEESLGQLYSNAMLFVLPSFYEGLPIALLEAMSYGLSCIASDIAANQEVGLSRERLFKAGDVKALAMKLKEFAQKPLSDEERKKQVEMVTQRYDWQRIAEKTLEVYRSLKV